MPYKIAQCCLSPGGGGFLAYRNAVLRMMVTGEDRRGGVGKERCPNTVV